MKHISVIPNETVWALLPDFLANNRLCGPIDNGNENNLQVKRETDIMNEFLIWKKF